MQIFFISDIWIVALSTILWVLFQFSAEHISHKVPDRWLSSDNFFFSEKQWEQDGKIYLKIFKVKKWKKYLPDGAGYKKGGYRKKEIHDFCEENLKIFLLESCRAELNHILAITPFWVFGLFAPATIIPYMFIYALLVNIPCIITQRYNRPRIIRTIERINKQR